ncbi:tyrosine-type recombinase/integrase [Aliivibrio fischeri]|uniref:tyrosine-type recombinase/integrase n=1 Tax=Aliivibrio fischeri TaxID=668 RepID=UPI0012DA4338|nr:tyrosine-type recombinase/integrase [Aliivibrio fischeri]MUJ28536.1 tyrosine-type recombinase/integrase [Aliivibrio fischeri]
MLSNQRLSSRKALYLVKSRTGVYAFRWNIRVGSIQHQPTLSLKTRDYLQAVNMASDLAIKMLSLSSPTLEDVKVVYSEFSGRKKREAKTLISIDMESLLSELSIKSRKEYLSCWNSFLDSLSSKAISVTSLNQAHIDKWKETQTCSDTTLKKKLKLLSSCFKKASIDCDSKWFKMKANKQPVRPRRAFTDKEVALILNKTKYYCDCVTKSQSEQWKYYLPRMALLTGCRLNELAQLRVGDIHFTNEPYLSINTDSEDKKLKNAASHREIPVTHHLKELLLPLLKSKEVHERLFPDLPFNESNGYTNTPSKWFSKLCREELNLKDVSFHSFRHYVITKLFNKGIKEELIGSLMGHSIGKLTTGKVYLSGFSYNISYKSMCLLKLF